MMRRSIYHYFFFLLLISVFYGVVELFIPFGGSLVAALICAVTFYPMYEALRRRIPKASPSFCAFIVDALVLVFFITPLLLLTWAIVQESSALVPALKQGTTTVAQLRAGDGFDGVPWVDSMRFFLHSAFGVKRAQFQEDMIRMVNGTLEYVSLAGTLLVKHSLGFVIDLMAMLFALFFLFRDGPKLCRYVLNLVPMRREDKERVTTRIHQTAIGLVRGLLLTSLLQGAMATSGYLIVGAEGAVLLGALTSAASLVPMIGTFAIWVPAGIFYFMKGSYLKGGFLLVWGAVLVVGVMDTVVRPYLVGKRAEIPLFILFFALLGGIEVWGAKGIILGPLLAAVVPVLLDIYRQRYLRQDDLIGEEESSHSARMLSVKI